MNQPHRKAMLKAAEEAAVIVRHYYAAITGGRHHEVGLKAKSPHPADVVTHADCEAQNSIEATLLAAFPDYGFYAEENGRNIDTPPAREGQRRFVVDPIDGTYNFSRGIPDFSISIALQEVQQGQWRNIAGLLSMPAHGEMFFAEGGKVSQHKNGKETTLALSSPLPLRERPGEGLVPHTQTSDARREPLTQPSPSGGEGSILRECRVEDAIYCLSNDVFQSAVLRYRDALVELGAVNIKSYSTAQRLGEIAAGRIPALIVGGDFYTWDVAAGLAIAEQAGATIIERTDMGLPVKVVGASPALARAVEAVWEKALNLSS